jgi:glucokinase
LIEGQLGPVQTFKVDEFPTLFEAAIYFLRQLDGAPDLHSAMFAVAGPVSANRCELTNCSWVVDGQELFDALRVKVSLINDFEAVAYSLPYLETSDVVKVGAGEAAPGAPIAVLGPGTGLGVACFVPGTTASMVLSSEGGHATLAGSNAREDAIISHLRGVFGHVSAERAISGEGLENIYNAVVTLDSLKLAPKSAAAITDSALSGDCRASGEALAIFCGLLGSFAGNTVLTFGARGGAYIAGGISPRIAGFILKSTFRNRFEEKGRFRDYLRQIPVKIMLHPAAAFLGLKAIVSLYRDTDTRDG